MFVLDKCLTSGSHPSENYVVDSIAPKVFIREAAASTAEVAS